jgi:Host cell surface-exposed lipoprotein
MFWGENKLTYPEDYGQPPQYPQQGYDQHSPQDEPWRPHQNDPFTYQQGTGPEQQGPVGQQYPREPQQPWEQPNSQQPFAQPWPPQDQQYAPQTPPWQQQSAMLPQTPKGQKRKSWPARHKVLTGLITFGALVIIAIASASNKPSTTASDTIAAASSTSPSAAVSSAAASSAPSTAAARARVSSAPSTPAAPASPSMTGAQQQAVDSAGDYLSEGQGFSKQGLLNQLTSSFGEGFSKSNAEFAIKYLNPNWDQQAVDSAKGYLGEGQGFSEQGLLQQLTTSAGEGFTEAQAEYAISYLHPDWDAQAVDSAKSYLGDGEGFSRSSLIQQLTSSYGAGFTEAQAEYAVNKVMP